ncbi:hydantoinase B/oxoprolinase family protein [Bosea sp. (in: a-proteobacteria)]|uniref:hydantoinase B/oxoprolinase family protein n=1 Tax=Bosea sp. (in: a-proteobacteria) TaxID=1871050 RepID=UPI00263027CB|nr:hydantoinase B/oxoprolinase family protein [Bosea sp. (in: a-proteobacteria)]MCO5093492.1 hydantoinase B/oxoprolinase family protein [Bosea sp. (in: a-proteobacteria)]
MDEMRAAILSNRFNAIVEEASTTLYRTAKTTFVKVVQDYQCAMATLDGEMFAYPLQSGVTSIIGAPLQKTLSMFRQEEWQEGDCVITNDPFSTEGLLTHIMDITLIRPIFVEGRLIAFGWAFVHATDVGGAVPGSISPHFTEVFQEGLRVRPMKLYRAGVLNEDIRDIYLDNSRIPEEMWGDLKAMLGSLVGMERRMVQLCRRYGQDAVRAGMDDVLSFAEEKARSVIKGIPDGVYRFPDYLEGIEDGEFSLINCEMTVEGDEVTFDFRGTDPQIPAAYNLTSGSRTHSQLVQAMVSYVLTVEPTTPRNTGILRPIKTRTPKGTILNAEFPAAGGARVASNNRVFDTIIGCLDQAVPGGIGAAGAGMLGIIVVGQPDRRTGHNRVNVVNPICGGGGGRNGRDGVDATDVRYGTLKNIPAEFIEVETFLRIRSYRLVPDSQGAGKWRGGAAISIEFENTGPRATITVRGLNRFHFRPWGVDGGQAGCLTEVLANPGTDRERSIGKITVHVMETGDVLRITSSAGGGFGDPLARDAASVMADMRGGLLTAEEASNSYGIVTDEDGRLDEAATAALRMRRSREGKPSQGFVWGAERDAQDRLWPPSLRASLAEEALKEHPRRRHLLVSRVCEEVRRSGQPVKPEILTELLGRYRNDSYRH